ncbi:MAG: ATP-binding cassette domain-containing protein [Anaerolineae bacterium]|nr:ATP-binding cassette domain-containing protein [Anaerolineae bacterium]
MIDPRTAPPVDSARTASERDDPFIEIQHVVKVFKTPAGDFPALRGVSASFRRGEFVSIVGKSGSGKSTLVNMLTGIDHPTSGGVRIAETYVHRLDESQMARWRGRNLGIVFQFYQLLPMLSLLENTLLPMDLAEVHPPAEREARAMELLGLVGLQHVAHKLPAEVSGGQQQSAAIARALANDPPLIVADEPTGNLDSHAAENVFAIFAALADRGKTILMVTHDTDLARRASRTLLLADGEVVDPAIAAALPHLTHEQMLHAARHSRSERYGAGEAIVRQGASGCPFYVIAEGYVDVVVAHPSGREDTVAQLGPGEHVSEVACLQHGAPAVATFRAAQHADVRVVALENHTLAALLDQSAPTRARLEQVARDRTLQVARVQQEEGERDAQAQVA